MIIVDGGKPLTIITKCSILHAAAVLDHWRRLTSVLDSNVTRLRCSGTNCNSSWAMWNSSRRARADMFIHKLIHFDVTILDYLGSPCKNVDDY